MHNATINLAEAAVATRDWWNVRPGSLRGAPFTDAETMHRRRAYLVHQAQRLARRAVKKGILPHPSESPCVDCGGPADSHEHVDYRRPLLVLPVCNPCHGRRPRALPWVPKQHNGNRDQDMRIYRSRPKSWNRGSDLTPDLGQLEAWAAEEAHACPMCGHAAQPLPRKEEAA